MATPDPQQVQPWYLRNITQALALDETTGNVYMRTGISGDVIIEGSVTIPGEVHANVYSVGNVDISGNTLPVSGNILAFQGDTPWEVTGNVVATQAEGTATYVKYANSENMQLDSAERLRISQAFDTWWFAPTVDKNVDFRYTEEEVGNGASSVFIQNLSSISLSSGTDSNGSMIRMSRRRHKTRPSASMRAAFSVNWNGYDNTNAVTKRAGLFTTFNGAFFQVTDDLSIVIRRRLADGTLSEKIIPRSEFNLDVLDGTMSPYDLRPNATDNFTSSITAVGPTTVVPVQNSTPAYDVVLTVADRSKFSVGMKGAISGITPSTFNGTVMVTAVSGPTGPGNITVTYITDPGVFTSLSTATFAYSTMHNQYIFGMDFNGNRISAIRFFVNGPYGRVVVHIERFGGPQSTPWANAPAMSTRYEVFNTIAPTFRPSFLTSSENVVVEAPPAENPAFGTAWNNTGVTYAKNTTVEYPIIGIGLRAGEPYQRADLRVSALQIIDIANINPQNSGVLFWRLLLNPTISGTVPAPVNVGKASRIWQYTTATTFTGGIELISGYITQAIPIDVRTVSEFIDLGSNVAYTDADKLVLVVKQLVSGVSDAKIVANFNFIELL